MFKIVLIFLISFLTSATAKSNFGEYKTKIDNISNSNIFIKNSNAFSIGSSGIVTHSFDGVHKTIVAIVEVVEKKENIAKLRYKNFDALKQSALPSYKIIPKIGDEITLNFLYTRALAICPNEDILNFIEKKYTDIEWIHPDILASKLYIDYTPRPKINDFTNQCKKSNFSLLFFAVEGKGYFVDCNSFGIIKEIALPSNLNKKEKRVPFYSRFKKIEGRMYGMVGGDSITNYDKYYKKLLKIK